MVKPQEEVKYGSSWISASQETLKLNSFGYSVPIKLNVSIHNVLVRAKCICLLWKGSGKGFFLVCGGKGPPSVLPFWSITPSCSECCTAAMPWLTFSTEIMLIDTKKKLWYWVRSKIFHFSRCLWSKLYAFPCNNYCPAPCIIEAFDFTLKRALLTGAKWKI